MKNIIDPNEIDKLYNDNHISLNEAEELRSKRWITFFGILEILGILAALISAIVTYNS